MALSPPAKRPANQAQFNLTANRSMSLTNLRVMLRLYGYWLESDGDLELTCRRYHEWATAWNKQVEDKGWKRSKAAVPPNLTQYMECLNSITASGGKGKTKSGGGKAGYDALRADMRRYIRRAQKIAQNVGKGVFPGTY